MNAKWTWIVGIAGIVGLIIAIVLGFESVPSSAIGAWFFGAAVGLGLGLILCVLVYFGRKATDAEAPSVVPSVPHTTEAKEPKDNSAEIADRLDALRERRRVINEEMTIAEDDAVSRTDAGISGGGREAVRWKSKDQAAREVKAKAKITRLTDELAEVNSKISTLEKKS